MVDPISAGGFNFGLQLPTGPINTDISGFLQWPSYTLPLIVPENPTLPAGGFVDPCNFPLSPTIPSMEAVLSGNFLRRQTPAEQVDDILGILRTGDGNWSGGSLVAQCDVSLYPTLPSVQSMMASVLSGDFLRRPTTAEIADDIVGVLRPAEGNWTGPAASLCGFGPTLVGVDPSGVGVCSDLVTPGAVPDPSPLMPLIVDPSNPYTGPIITLFGGSASPLMPLIVDPSQPYTGPIIDLMGGSASPLMPFITDPNQPYDGPVIKLVNFRGVSSLWDSGESEARTDWSSICPITFCENDMRFADNGQAGSGPMGRRRRQRVARQRRRERLRCMSIRRPRLHSSTLGSCRTAESSTCPGTPACSITRTEGMKSCTAIRRLPRGGRRACLRRDLTSLWTRLLIRWRPPRASL